MAYQIASNQNDLRLCRKVGRRAYARAMMARARGEGPDLSKFPDDLLEQIISFFPLKLAVRAGLISKRFRYSWKLNRDLTFDIPFALLPHGKEQMARIVDGVLNQHIGPKIDKLGMIFDPTDQESLVKGWILKVVEKGIEELNLDFSAGHEAFWLTSDEIDVPSIRVLKLSYCELSLSPRLTGLCFLRTLVLEEVRILTVFTDIIFGNCLLLEDFGLIRCSCPSYHLEILAGDLKNFRSFKVADIEDLISIFIQAPTLRSFSYKGEVCAIKFNNILTHLNDATFNFVPRRGILRLHEVEDLITTLNFVKKLKICSTILESLSPKFVDSEYKDFQFCLWNLTDLELYVGGSGPGRGSSFINTCDIACFLQKCPHLDRVLIDLGEIPFDHGLFWELEAKKRFEMCRPSFRFLRYIVVKGFKYRELEMALAKFLLEHAKGLYCLTLAQAKNIPISTAPEKFRFTKWIMDEKHRAVIQSYHEHEKRIRALRRNFL